MSFNQRAYSILKRLGDIVFSIILLFLFFPVFILIALLIRLNARGPIFYFQERMGKEERKIIVYKFRTMRVGARELSKKEGKPIELYITEIGKLIKGPRIDELPQLVNILRGEMSFIGPRPNNIYKTELELIKENPKRKNKFKVNPGILGIERLFSVWPEIKKVVLKKMSNTEILLSLDPRIVANKLDFELYYIDNISLYLDIILFYYGIRLFFREAINSLKILNNK